MRLGSGVPPLARAWHARRTSGRARRVPKRRRRDGPLFGVGLPVLWERQRGSVI